MSEVLRAICEKNCVSSRLVFYAAQLNQPVTNAATSYGRRRASIACKSDCYFLAMGATQDSALTGAGEIGWQTRSVPTSYIIERGSLRESYANVPVLQFLQNYNLNNFVTLDEYVLFAPAELIVINQDVRLTSPVIAGTDVVFVTIQGIEYRFPSGKG